MNYYKQCQHWFEIEKGECNSFYQDNAAKLNYKFTKPQLYKAKIVLHQLINQVITKNYAFFTLQFKSGFPTKLLTKLNWSGCLFYLFFYYVKDSNAYAYGSPVEMSLSVKECL